MSRGFVKEGDQEEIPMVPPRAHLPNGIENYVTEKGLLALLKEKESLIKERDSYKQDMKNSGAEADIRVTRNFINAKIDLLDERIKTAKVIKSSDRKSVV